MGTTSKALVLVALAGLAAIPIRPCAAQGGGKRVSTFGRYEGYSKPQYEYAIRRSVYMSTRDGTRRAVDIYQPAVKGTGVAGRYPVVYESQRYVRAWKNTNGTLDTPLGTAPSHGPFRLDGGGNRFLPWFVRHGYVVVIADMRGAGASFGPEVEEGSLEAGLDEYDVIEWIARQPWSDGNVGMIGVSYAAEAQIMAAATHPPHLKALIPVQAEFDRFQGDAFMMGGILRYAWLADWLRNTNRRNSTDKPAEPVPAARSIAPVDDDSAGLQLAQAIADRRTSVSAARQQTFKDYIDLGMVGELFWDEFPYSRRFVAQGTNQLSNHLEQVNTSGIPTYLFGGWLDLYTSASTRYFNTLTVPKKLTMGPWAHGFSLQGGATLQGADASFKRILQVEGLRWFDHYLKRIDNGIMKQPAVTYAVMDGSPAWTSGPSKWIWLQGNEWPIPSTTSVLAFLGPGPTGTVKSSNDGLLSLARRTLEPGGRDGWLVDYSTTTASVNRWIGEGIKVWGDIYADMGPPNDVKGLTYTTAPLPEAVVITGHPIVTLYATSTAPDGDFIAYLEDVDQNNRSQYRTEGMLRASHRVLGDPPPYYYAGVPLPDSRRSVVRATPALSDGVAELQFELYPTSSKFNKGHRIRLTIVGIDRDNTATPVLNPPPKVTVFHSSRYPSNIELPILPTELLTKGIKAPSP